MTDCCNNDTTIEALRVRQSGTLRVVLIINALMFMVMAAAAFYAHSSALLADSLDNLGDALTYALSLYVVTRSARAKAWVALFKGMLIFMAACGVASQIIYKLFVPVAPVFELMGLFSLIALVANSACFYLLWQHRHEDLNMSSVWECSRNDIATNLSVMVAAGAVWITGAGWPDLVIAAGLVLLLLRSAIQVIARAIRELRTSTV